MLNKGNPFPLACPGSFQQVQQDSCSSAPHRAVWTAGSIREWNEVFRIGKYQCQCCSTPLSQSLENVCPMIIFHCVIVGFCSGIQQFVSASFQSLPQPSLVFHIQACFSQSIPHLSLDVVFGLCLTRWISLLYWMDFCKSLIQPEAFFTLGVQQVRSDHYKECIFELPEVMGCTMIIYSIV